MGAIYTNTNNAISLSNSEGAQGLQGQWGNQGTTGDIGNTGNKGAPGLNNYLKSEIRIHGKNGEPSRIINSNDQLTLIAGLNFPGTLISGTPNEVRLISRINSDGELCTIKYVLINVTSNLSSGFIIGTFTDTAGGYGSTSDLIIRSMTLNTFPTTSSLLLLYGCITPYIKPQAQYISKLASSYSPELAILYKEQLFTQPYSLDINNILNVMQNSNNLKAIFETPIEYEARLAQNTTTVKRMSAAYDNATKANEGTPPEIIPALPVAYLETSYLEII